MDFGLPRGFRKLGAADRRAALDHALGGGLWVGCDIPPEHLELADVLVEHAVGLTPVPLGIATGFLVDSEDVLVPMATEEPSIIAAASYGALLVSTSGGFTTWATAPVMCAHVYLQDVPEPGLERMVQAEPDVRRALHPLLKRMEARGGGYRGCGITRMGRDLVRVELRLDVRDSMGANLLNTAAERMGGLLARAGGGRVLMCVLSNTARARRAGARFTLPVSHLGPACPSGMSAGELARRVAAASDVAQTDPDRAVTHNKGIMNGISALALATGNDTRAAEAAAHAWAAQSGRYVGLSQYALGVGQDGRTLTGEIELPLPLGTVGGSVGFAPAFAAALRILGAPSAVRLSRIAAAVGLAQNLAALIALCGAGIQKGHLPLHGRRLAWKAGARGAEVHTLARWLAETMATQGSVDAASLRARLEQMRKDMH